jgi:acyl-CoA dehydrogenase
VIRSQETLNLLLDSIIRFVRERLVPNEEIVAETDQIPAALLQEMKDLGLFGLCLPEEYGGLGLTMEEEVLAAMELGKTSPAFRSAIGSNNGIGSTGIVIDGTPAQKEKYLPRLASGELIGSFCLTEPEAGSDAASLRTTAVRDGDHYVLNGAKMFITNGVHGDLYFIAARTDPEAKGSRAITMFMVEKGTPGFRVGRALDKTGWRCSDTAELVFEDCRVPAKNVLGEPNRGFYSIMANFQTERLVIGAMAMAEAREAIRLTFDYVNQRTAFGAPLWEKQTIRQRLSRRLAEVEAARQLVHHTAWLDAEGRDCVAQVSMVKALAGDLVNEVLYDCVQFHGGMGFIRETAIERMSRDARVQAIGGGASEVMLEEIAKRFGQALSD